MVRLKATTPFTQKHRFTNFNSTMVRLKVQRYATQQRIEHISIPLWYD